MTEPSLTDAERVSILTRHLSESEARARVAEGAYQQMRGEAIAVTPEIRFAVDAVREAEQACRDCCGARDEHGNIDKARLALADLILSALPPVQP